MARRSRSAQLENRTNRLQLTPRPKPYFVGIGRGVHLGYRRLKGDGSWTVKASNSHGGHWTKKFATADDHEDANGGTLLDFWQAQDRARTLARAGNDDSGDRPATVSEALDNFASELRGRGGDKLNVSRVRRHLPQSLANKTVSLLTARDLRKWRDGMLEAGLAPASVNRTARGMAAALSLAAREDSRITNTGAWRHGLKALANAESARNSALTDDQVRALIAASYELNPEFGLWVRIHAETGARTSQLKRLMVHDLQDNGAAPRLMMPHSGKGKHKKRDARTPVPITTGLARALRLSAGGRELHEWLLNPPGGAHLLLNWLSRAGAAAELKPGVTFYSLRHSSITRMLLAGAPIRVVAVHHNTSLAMIEQNYSRFIGDHSDALVRRTLLDISAPADAKVVPMVRS